MPPSKNDGVPTKSAGKFARASDTARMEAAAACPNLAEAGPSLGRQRSQLVEVGPNLKSPGTG